MINDKYFKFELIWWEEKFRVEDLQIYGDVFN